MESVSNSARVIHTGPVDDTYLAYIASAFHTVRSAIASVGDVIHTGSRSDEVMRQVVYAGAQEMERILQHILREFNILLTVAGTRLQTDLSRDVWGLQWGIGQIFFNGALLLRYYIATYRNRRQRPRNAEREQFSAPGGDDAVPPTRHVLRIANGPTGRRPYASSDPQPRRATSRDSGPG